VSPVRPDKRIVYLGGRYVDIDGEEATVGQKYCDNTVTTSKVHFTPCIYLHYFIL